MVRSLEQRREYQREYYKKNQEKLKERSRTYRQNNPEKSKEHSRKNYETHKEARQEYLKQYYVDNLGSIRQYRKDNRERFRETRRSGQLKYTFGITLEQWNELFEEQNWCCAICNSSEPNSKVGWSTDHNHLTNKVRGILCPGCNAGLGHFRENLNSLQEAINYLRNNS